MSLKLRSAVTTTVEIEGYLERRLDLLISLGLYATKSEAVRDAVRHLLEKTDLTSIAVEMYSQGRVSLGFCVEAADLSAPEFLLVLQRRGLRPSLGCENMGELEQQVSKVSSVQRMVVEGYTLSMMFEGFGAQFLHKLAPRLALAQVELEQLPLDLRRLVLSVQTGGEKGFDLVNSPRGAEDFASRNGLSTGEAASVQAASKLKAVLVTDDSHVRLAAEAAGVPCATSVSLAVWAFSRNLVAQDEVVSAFERLYAQGYYLPLSPAELGSRSLAIRVAGE